MIYFIAAGKGSRMKSSKPKALHDVLGAPNVVRNINLIKDFTDYRVVVNISDRKKFSEYVEPDKIITIESGYGSGHAIMKLNLSNDDIIIWGDAVITNIDIIKELIEYESSNYSLIVPLKKVKNPYVNFLQTGESKIKEVLFSKYGEISKSGYQDCCIFKVSGEIQKHLKSVHNSIWKDRYITESSEFEFLYIIHYLYNISEAADGYLTEYPESILSYNTQVELVEIENIL
jgi:bifunctional N-acetylglucosamine-1-phosphate-uridyltransferase/glucosamine-1-phosphate-acetyltransferase GlmU-like protein